MFAYSRFIILFTLLSLTQFIYAEEPFPDWHKMDKISLDRSYNNSLAVPESNEMFNKWVLESKKFREAHAEHLDVPYGPSSREKLDLFIAAPHAPTLVFIHGGFWQMRSKNDFAFIAKPFVQAGINVVMIGYPLAPEASMTEIVSATQRAINYISEHIDDWQGDPKRVVVTGWSSGGHLTAEVMSNPVISAIVPLSGIYDLQPLVGSYINVKLKLTDIEIKKYSPLFHTPPKSLPIYLFVGGDELSEMRRQSYDYGKKLSKIGQPGFFKEIPGKNHYTILADMIDTNGEIYHTLMTLLNNKN